MKTTRRKFIALSSALFPALAISSHHEPVEPEKPAAEPEEDVTYGLRLRTESDSPMNVQWEHSLDNGKTWKVIDPPPSFDGFLPRIKK